MYCPKDPVCLSLLHQRDTTEVSFVPRLYGVPFSATCGSRLWDPPFQTCSNCLVHTMCAFFQTYRYLIQILLSGIINRHFIRYITIKSLFLKHTHKGSTSQIMYVPIASAVCVVNAWKYAQPIVTLAERMPEFSEGLAAMEGWRRDGGKERTKRISNAVFYSSGAVSCHLKGKWTRRLDKLR